MIFNRNLTFGVLLLVSAFMAGCGGGAQPTTDIAAEPAAALGWPPPSAIHMASDITAEQEGVQYLAAGGNIANFGSDLVMTGEGILPWAIYTIGQLDYENELVSIACEYTETPDEEGDGTEVFFAVANFNLKTWVWIDAPTGESPWLCPEIEAHRYRSDEGNAYLAVVLNGPGLGRIDTVTFTHETQQIIVEAPEHLTAEATAVQEVTLDWDDVPDAVGYNVFRSTQADFASQAKINTELVATSTYVDSLSTNGRYYFYRVTAVATNESDPSNIARVWIFGDDLPAPFNLQVTARGDGSFTGGWEWDDPVGGNPYGFRLYIDTIPFFTLDSETMQTTTTFGASRSNTFHGLEEGVTYYWKLCAYDGISSPLGRISDEATGTGTGSWTWGAFEVIGTGQPPVRAVVGDSEIAVSYFENGSVEFAIQEGDTWRIETALDPSIRMPGDNGSQYADAGPFTEQQDLAYGAGAFLAVGFGSTPGDCWVSEWHTEDGPDSWSSTRIHGDGEWELTPRSGLNAVAVASETEFAVLHYYLSDLKLLLHTKSIAGGSWSESTIRSGYSSGCTPSHSASFHGDNLYVLATENLINELYFGDRTGGWAWDDVRDGTAPKLSKHHDLQWFENEWWSTGFQTADKDLYLVHGSTLPWAADREDGVGGVIAGYDARMDVEGDEAIVIQFKDGKYYFGFYSEGWDWGPINVPGVADYGSGADVVLRNGSPYIVFQDEDTGEIKIAMGTPPV